MSAAGRRPDTVTGADTGAEAGPSHLLGAARLPAGRLSVVVGRALGAVVVTVRGQLDLGGCELIESILTDLIEGQGNQTVAVDLGKAVVDPEAHRVFVAAARQAHHHGARFVLKEPPTETHNALQLGGSPDLMEILPRR
ncbi:MAG: hypothetical protein M3083_07070 [Actinomycetota bacterium]|nr:hypothetical protein [Actinomycetota bacterium]